MTNYIMMYHPFLPFTGVAAAHLGLIDKNCVAKVLLMPSASQGRALRFIGKISTSVCTEVVFSRETLHGRRMSPLEATKFYQVPSSLSYKREKIKVQNNHCKARKQVDMNTLTYKYIKTVVMLLKIITLANYKGGVSKTFSIASIGYVWHAWARKSC